MQDIDFDEIDRAVSSVTTPSPKNDTPPVSLTPEQPVETPIASPAVRRSSGRFMDVVHASSDMRPTMTRSQAPTITNPARQPAVPAPSPAQTAPTVPEANTVEAFHWPDPIDAHEATAPEPPTQPVVETPATADEPVAPLDSPFLSGAKVEKRPLGAFSDAEPELLTAEDFPSSQTQPPEPAPETTPEPETPQNHEEPADIPPELHEDLLKLDTHSETAPAETESTPPPTPLVSEDVPVGPTSITQQYKEQSSSSNEPSGAIFDTEVYNQALVHTPRKSKKVLIVVWIAALILVGGGIGAGIYFVVLPMFN